MGKIEKFENIDCWKEAMNFMNFMNFQTLQTAKKLGLWFMASLAISLIFFQEFWASLGTMLSPDWIFGQNNASPWGVLGLCGIWLWLKRKEIWKEILESWQVRKLQVGRLEGRGGEPYEPSNFINLQTFEFALLGLALVAGAILMPSSRDFLVFQVLLASLGVFVIFFGRAAKIPSILLGIYSLPISFPLLINKFAQLPYSIIAIKPLMWILTSLGYPFQNQGQLIYFTSASGEPISVAIIAACMGPATMGVFLAIFALMMLDTPLPPKKAAWLFLFGVAGTWFQSFIRLIFLLLVGYHWGADALWADHSWITYVLFPLWYLLFAYIYFRQAGGWSQKLKKQKVVGRL